MSDAPPPQCVFLFDMTRHRSHLFFRFLSTHPNIKSYWHPYLPAFLFGPERITQHTKKADADAKKANVEWDGALSDQTYSDANEKFLRAFEQAQSENKIFIANEHCQMVQKQAISLAIIRNQPTPHPSSNPTVIPDHTFQTLTPIFIIRHPIFSIPSNYKNFLQASSIRPGDEDWDLITSLHIQRHLFDFFHQRDGHPSLVIDGDDTVWKTDEVRRRVSEALRIDPEGFSERWEAVPEEARAKDALLRHFLQVSDESTGIVRLTTDGPPEYDLERAFGEWVGEFGEEVAGLLREMVEENLGCYEYMKSFAS